MNVLQTLKERGFIEQTTHDQELEDLLSGEQVSCYIGFDPTASSLHVGSLVPIMSLAHMQRAGHRPIALVGGGTGLVGDPSGKTEMRQLLTLEDVNNNAEGIRAQLARFIDFDKGAVQENNANWLVGLKYIEFLRDFGRHFSVNRMIKAESYRMRLESEEGLSFIEFNYMLLQAYDFLHLFNAYGCQLQMGGSDQWGNIVAGIDLIRRAKGGSAYGITFPLITTSAGIKMGKTHKGAVWLDPDRTSPYEYFQFWVNTHDDDVPRFLALFTFLPMEQINRVKDLDGAELNLAKTILAFEATTLAHGRDQAVGALEAAYNMFGARSIPSDLLAASSIPREGAAKAEDSVPTTVMDLARLEEGVPAFELFDEIDLCASRGAARRLLGQGGGYVNNERIESFDYKISLVDMKDNEIILRAGKKNYHRLVVSEK
ncbi:tyrosyl-tRNA synthetase [Desulfatibacillum alkenivorans DSM 16219]|jgi:tyrosyl-tRNA synthetase|uniref:Tyrosine--tRNA ligase n=1 Tax=Desulfatibacillum alkenivorans DSM 16219 TaxID=1121393 RepID=A0A1M6JPT8_9BACT|nr:tyrosine--tRNA ligase [Desulfatibacillum alkenivorans]SHJ48737.1 tyrosyl-tRNA synthetase [Desulfatibacillum alkenivorans DSM 16219]